MATNFTVIVFQRQHFGDDPGSFNDVEPDVPFAGSAKSFPFDCPGVDPGETGVLMFQLRDVDHRLNVIRVNGVDVFGGLPVTPARDAWNANGHVPVKCGGADAAAFCARGRGGTP